MLLIKQAQMQMGFSYFIDEIRQKRPSVIIIKYPKDRQGSGDLQTTM